MKRYGIEWENDGDSWSSQRGRYRPGTWQFGEIHQCVVDVDSPSAHPWRGHIRICLPPQKTRFAAMKRAARWIDEYEESGPLGAEKTIKNSLRDWPDLYEDRLDVLNQLFFVGGSGYDWLDGALIRSDQQDVAEAATDRRMWRRARARTEELRRGAQEAIARARELLGDKVPSLPPEPVPRRRAFYPVSEHECIARVPEDVRPDWLRVAYEAAEALRDSTVVAERPDGAAVLVRNQHHGREIVADLKQRFPGRVP